MKPTPAKPRIIMAQVAGSGTEEATTILSTENHELVEEASLVRLFILKDSRLSNPVNAKVLKLSAPPAGRVIVAVTKEFEIVVPTI